MQQKQLNFGLIQSGMLEQNYQNILSEIKKKNNSIKEATEKALAIVKSVEMQNLATHSQDLITPYCLCIESKQKNLYNMALIGFQKLFMFSLVDQASLDTIIDVLIKKSDLVDEIRVLQTIIIAITMNNQLRGPNLAKLLAHCFQILQINNAKNANNSYYPHESMRKTPSPTKLDITNSSVIVNTASATIQQIVSVIFDRIILDFSVNSMELPRSFTPTKENNLDWIENNKKYCADAYHLFKDLCGIANGDENGTKWLTTTQSEQFSISRLYAIHLIEILMHKYTLVFQRLSPFTALLKEQVCPLIIKAFSPQISYNAINCSVKAEPGMAGHQLIVVRNNTNEKNSNKQLNSSNETANGEQLPYDNGSDNTPDLNDEISAMSLGPNPGVLIMNIKLLKLVYIILAEFMDSLLMECEIFICMLIKFLDPFTKPLWLRIITLETLHLLLKKPKYLRTLCENYDLKPHNSKIFHLLLQAIETNVKSAFCNETKPGNNTKIGNNKEQNGILNDDDIIGERNGDGNNDFISLRKNIGDLIQSIEITNFKCYYLTIINDKYLTQYNTVLHNNNNTPPHSHNSAVNYGNDIIPAPMNEALNLHLTPTYALNLLFICVTDLTDNVCDNLLNNSQIHQPTQIDEIQVKILQFAWYKLLVCLTILLRATESQTMIDILARKMHCLIGVCGLTDMKQSVSTILHTLCSFTLPYLSDIRTEDLSKAKTGESSPNRQVTPNKESNSTFSNDLNQKHLRCFNWVLKTTQDFGYLFQQQAQWKCLLTIIANFVMTLKLTPEFYAYDNEHVENNSTLAQTQTFSNDKTEGETTLEMMSTLLKKLFLTQNLRLYSSKTLSILLDTMIQLINTRLNQNVQILIKSNFDSIISSESPQDSTKIATGKIDQFNLSHTNIFPKLLAHDNIHWFHFLLSKYFEILRQHLMTSLKTDENIENNENFLDLTAFWQMYVDDKCIKTVMYGNAGLSLNFLNHCCTYPTNFFLSHKNSIIIPTSKNMTNAPLTPNDTMISTSLANFIHSKVLDLIQETLNTLYSPTTKKLKNNETLNQGNEDSTKKMATNSLDLINVDTLEDKLKFTQCVMLTLYYPVRKTQDLCDTMALREIFQNYENKTHIFLHQNSNNIFKTFYLKTYYTDLVTLIYQLAIKHLNQLLHILRNSGHQIFRLYTWFSSSFTQNISSDKKDVDTNIFENNNVCIIVPLFQTLSQCAQFLPKIFRERQLNSSQHDDVTDFDSYNSEIMEEIKLQIHTNPKLQALSAQLFETGFNALQLVMSEYTEHCFTIGLNNTMIFLPQLIKYDTRTHKFDQDVLITIFPTIFDCILSFVSPQKVVANNAMAFTNISLTGIGLMWNISDFLHNRTLETFKTINTNETNKRLYLSQIFSQLWCDLYDKTAQCCTHEHSAVRKSGIQTYFSMLEKTHFEICHQLIFYPANNIVTHMTKLENADSIPTVLDNSPSHAYTVFKRIIIPLLTNISLTIKSLQTIPHHKLPQNAENSPIIIHHTRDSPLKQWSETQCLALEGIARIFQFNPKSSQMLAKNGIFLPFNFVDEKEFEECWIWTLRYLSQVSKNGTVQEICSCALKCFKELYLYYFSTVSALCKNGDNYLAQTNPQQQSNSNIADPNKQAENSQILSSTMYEIWFETTQFHIHRFCTNMSSNLKTPQENCFNDSNNIHMSNTLSPSNLCSNVLTIYELCPNFTPYIYTNNKQSENLTILSELCDRICHPLLFDFSEVPRDVLLTYGWSLNINNNNSETVVDCFQELYNNKTIQKQLSLNAKKIEKNVVEITHDEPTLLGFENALYMSTLNELQKGPISNDINTDKNHLKTPEQPNNFNNALLEGENLIKHLNFAPELRMLGDNFTNLAITTLSSPFQKITLSFFADLVNLVTNSPNSKELHPNHGNNADFTMLLIRILQNFTLHIYPTDKQNVVKMANSNENSRTKELLSGRKGQNENFGATCFSLLNILYIHHISQKLPIKHHSKTLDMFANIIKEHLTNINLPLHQHCELKWNLSFRTLTLLTKHLWILFNLITAEILTQASSKEQNVLLSKLYEIINMIYTLSTHIMVLDINDKNNNSNKNIGKNDFITQTSVVIPQISNVMTASQVISAHVRLRNWILTHLLGPILTFSLSQSNFKQILVTPSTMLKYIEECIASDMNIPCTEFLNQFAFAQNFSISSNNLLILDIQAMSTYFRTNCLQMLCELMGRKYPTSMDYSSLIYSVVERILLQIKTTLFLYNKDQALWVKYPVPTLRLYQVTTSLSTLTFLLINFKAECNSDSQKHSNIDHKKVGLSAVPSQFEPILLEIYGLVVDSLLSNSRQICSSLQTVLHQYKPFLHFYTASNNS